MDSKIYWFEVIHSNHFVVKGLPPYYARGTRGLLMRGLEPKLRNRSEPARRSNVVTRDETYITAFQISH